MPKSPTLYALLKHGCPLQYVTMRSLEGFQVLRFDTNRHGGGIIMLIHNSLVPKVVVAGPDNLELLIISVTNQVNTCKHHLGLFYRPHSSGVQCLDELPCWFRPIMFF